MIKRGTVVTALVIASLIGAGCGGEKPRYDDRRIVKRLGLEKTDDGKAYMIDGDPFCEISRKLLNDAEELERAAERDKLGLVIASRAGNVGVKGVPPFGIDCKGIATKRLNKLDPPER